MEASGFRNMDQHNGSGEGGGRRGWSRSVAESCGDDIPGAQRYQATSRQNRLMEEARSGGREGGAGRTHETSAVSRSKKQRIHLRGKMKTKAIKTQAKENEVERVHMISECLQNMQSWLTLHGVCSKFPADRLIDHSNERRTTCNIDYTTII